MAINYTPETALPALQEKSGADQSALYYFSANFSRLLLCAHLGREQSPARYWRSSCTDASTMDLLLRSREPFSLSGQPITGAQEEIVAAPILNGDRVIGAVIHCYHDHSPQDLAPLLQEVNVFQDEFYLGWIDFLVAEQSRPLPALLHIAGVISSSLDLDRVLLNVVEQGTVLFRAKMSSLMLVNVKRRELELTTAYGCSLEYLDKPNLPLEGSILGTVVRLNRIMQVPNVLKEPLYFHKDMAVREGVCSLLAAPISFQNEVLGVLSIYSANPQRWQRSEMELLQTFADHAAIAITNVRVHEQNMAMEERLHESAKRATLGELAAGLAHEIRNPLAVINMLIHSWKSTPPDDEDFQRDVDVIAQKISDLNNLVTDLLNLAKSRPLERRMQDIDALIERVLRLLRHRISKQRVSVSKRAHTDRTSAPVDRERLEQAILNLLLNALDATPEDGVIRVDLRTQDDQLLLDITDSGPGIPPDKELEIFKAFRTNKPHGAGMGLPIAQRIINEHQGKIYLSHSSAEGATFTISLPYSIPE
ncbi:MAG: GAF domain-containing protein [Candidatus Omnitrophica bacterium]|nr:GAF domain-containing protein [Candidatus Omnitrophota bacterium]